LGGNEALVKMATSLDPKNRSRIVQSRLVDRHNRVELGLNYGGVAGGDSYLYTQNLGVSLDWHINPKFSIGARYYDYNNSLTPEGARVFDDARAAYAAGNRSYSIPDIDYPLSAAMAVANWYPIYGKLNWFDSSIAQFDLYLVGGGGQIQLSSGSAPLYTAGIGVGLWMSQHWTARGEIRWQTYQDEIISGSRQIQGVVGTVGLGYLL
jgi:outer membrane beta-barrel protein